MSDTLIAWIIGGVIASLIGLLSPWIAHRLESKNKRELISKRRENYDQILNFIDNIEDVFEDNLRYPNYQPRDHEDFEPICSEINSLTRIFPVCKETDKFISAIYKYADATYTQASEDLKAAWACYYESKNLFIKILRRHSHLDV